MELDGKTEIPAKTFQKPEIGSRNMRRLLAGILASFVIAGCSEQQPLMSMTQQKSYNECMSGRWSGAADTFVWGPFGWAYYNSARNDCVAKSGAVGTEEATTPTSAPGPVQPVSAGEATPSGPVLGAQPSSSSVSH